jgi:acyl-CoA reductase-like NAD-dependent aldehyde dehydrogenase
VGHKTTDRSRYEKVLSFINSAQAEGAKLVTGGSQRPPAAGSKGFFVQPTVFEVEPSHSLWKEEVFGPVLGVKSFSTEEEAVALANDSTYGLAANVFSADEERADRVASRLRAGKVSAQSMPALHIATSRLVFRSHSNSRSRSRTS